MTAPAVGYQQRPGVPPEGELDVLADIYKLAIEAAELKEGSRPGALDAAKGSKHDSRRPNSTG